MKLTSLLLKKIDKFLTSILFPGPALYGENEMGQNGDAILVVRGAQAAGDQV